MNCWWMYCFFLFFSFPILVSEFTTFVARLQPVPRQIFRRPPNTKTHGRHVSISSLSGELIESYWNLLWDWMVKRPFNYLRFSLAKVQILRCFPLSKVTTREDDLDGMILDTALRASQFRSKSSIKMSEDIRVLFCRIFFNKLVFIDSL